MQPLTTWESSQALMLWKQIIITLTKKMSIRIIATISNTNNKKTNKNDSNILIITITTKTTMIKQHFYYLRKNLNVKNKRTQMQVLWHDGGGGGGAWTFTRVEGRNKTKWNKANQLLTNSNRESLALDTSTLYWVWTINAHKHSFMPSSMNHVCPVLL